MALFSLPPQKVEMVLLALLALAAIFDIRGRRIPNWLTLSGVLLGFLINTLIGPPEGGFLFALEGFLAGFGVYMVLYILRAMGAGDVKLMAAVGALAGWQRWFGIFLITAIVGGAMALLLVTLRRRLGKTLWNVGFILSELGHGRPAYAGKEELDVRSPRAVGLPHGAVIAIGTVFYLAAALRLSR
ncbi:MAG TPA: A24 family peptidase [Bryobacteraceae bacterium]|jgi:prepilin peptidase CpaA|nr:A24 family peptidase [Bryobacteraceae bacterium]